ncbi:transcriptional regulator [Pseudomonas sp. FW306-02-F02-AA]|uniref:Transcriptional regulator n=1 Tax=Pseudomonas fluorescens TaxID=294 RepID=A0A0N9WMV7_PSEFL|nr:MULTISPECIES: winged helix-turn-helix domain-containing protein [Pseudomonas]ALI03658.1 transcriptional regulator [Pseudomonas fluorescens]PMZ02031.1 transcriptional regulator [Pseudomonas sp. FW306-02-F02-AB]PMZ08042.1 transcriptional regulator [Pseudomonas sp. FW306-02-H06C]PMZ14738.1 transcriptional regulator [Pseudomonas sp. FW306-02-F02-AA]PMZ20677.1 transcriptional regulator HilA [Pseudomonas sp. FW306-02-F08-AA]
MTLSPEQAVHFGPYRVYPGQRLVLEADQPLRLGRRAMDILLILLEHAGNVVSKQQLIAQVWPKCVVEDINLRVHIAALRKALGDGQAGQRYIVTVAQRGYSFVAPYSLEHIEQRPPSSGHEQSGHNLPIRRTRMIGRQALVDSLVTNLPRQRLITLVGPGGIGKTTVALRVAEQLIGRYRDGIRLLDLAQISDPLMIATHLATLLDLSLHDTEPMNCLTTFLRERQMLLVIDNCEHLIDAVALLSESILRGAPDVHILATSRESLRAEGEFVQRLESLDCPPPIAALDRSQALSFSAVQLFIERAMASHDSFELSDAELPLAIEICRRLDGIPLAIELAAAQVNSLGLSGLLTQLQGSFRLLAQGCQTALGRHQTLRATLDWSFELLSTCEQTCLRRLGVFRGGFTLESAAAVIVGEHIEPREVFGAITQLVAKSLLNVEVGDEQVFYRLLDTTRSYALEKLDQANDLPDTLERHAERCLALMHQAQNDWEHIQTDIWIERYARSLEDIRSALDWGLNAQGPQALAIRLASVSTPLWQELSLLKEHGVYVRKALALLELTPEPCPRLKMALKLALGSSCYHTQGGTAETVEAFVSARTLAERCNDVAGQLRAVSGHMAVNLSCGNYQTALEQSQQFDRLGVQGNAAVSLSTHRLQVLALHFAGDQQRARESAEQVIQRMAQSGHLNRFTHGFGVQYDQSVAALTILARILWLQGHPEKAWSTARQALGIALQIDHGTSICYTLALSGCLIAHYNGDTQTARDLLRLLLEQAQKHSVLLFYNWARHYAQVIDSHGAHPDPQPGTGLIKEIMVTLDSGFVDDALLARAENGAAGWSTAEILRARANALLAENSRSAAETVLLKALAVAKAQGALAWELRTATSLAELWQHQGRLQQAYDLLEPIYNRFTEGFATPDLSKVRRLLDELQRHRPS